MFSFSHKIVQWIYSLKKRSIITVNGCDFVIPHKDKFHNQHLDSYEDYYGDFIKAATELSRGAFVDIGVNVGQILLKLRSFNKTQEYVGFEVSVSCCDYVNGIIDKNGLENCMVVPLGLSNTRGIISLHFSSASDPQATLVGDFWTSRNQRKFERRVYVETGDAVLAAAGVTQVGVIKIDVEGGELEVLLGLKETIVRDRPIILMEVLPFLTNASGPEVATMKRRQERCLQLEAFLDEVGYRSFRALPGFRIEEAQNFGAEAFEADRTNYVMVARDAEVRFRALFA